MAVRRMNKIIAVLLVTAIAGFFVLCDVSRATAMVDPSPSEEQAKAAAASTDGTAQTEASSAAKKSKAKSKTDTSTSDASNAQSGSGSNNLSGSSGSDGSNDSSGGNDAASSGSSDDEDVVDENAFSTSGNATLGDMIKSSGTKDFYTIRTDNDNTFYLVIDHSGNMDNVYMLSTIDENDLKEFLEDGESTGGTLILPETMQPETTENVPETTEKEQEQSRIPGIISLVLLIAGGIAGVVLFRKYRRDAGEPEDDYSENMESDELPTVNEDDEFLE